MRNQSRLNSHFLVVVSAAAGRRMTASIRPLCSGVKIQASTLISGVRGMKWRTFHTEWVAPATDRTLTEQGMYADITILITADVLIIPKDCETDVDAQTRSIINTALMTKGASLTMINNLLPVCHS